MIQGESSIKRLFFALPVEFHVTNKLKELFDLFNAHGRDCKTVAKENFHITLKFLGQVEEKVYRALIVSFERAEIPNAAISYRIRGTGAFPNTKRPSVLWCGIDTDIVLIRNLQEIIEHLAEQHGFAREKRSFTPHLTVARVRQHRTVTGPLQLFFESNSDTDFGESRFDRIVLFESTVTSKGPLYTPLLTRNLQ